MKGKIVKLTEKPVKNIFATVHNSKKINNTYNNMTDLITLKFKISAPRTIDRRKAYTMFLNPTNYYTKTPLNQQQKDMKPNF